jgi:hypothetical protein
VDGSQVAELPCAEAKKEAEDIRLLLLVKFFKILVSAHSLSRNPTRSKITISRSSKGIEGEIQASVAMETTIYT